MRFGGDSPVRPANDGETVSVPIHLAVAPVVEGALSTKTDYDPDSPGYDADNAVKTITVMQFEKDPEGDGYTRVGTLNTYSWPLEEGENIALAVSGRKNIVFVLANATGPGIDRIPLSGTSPKNALDYFLKNENTNTLNSLDSIWYVPKGGGPDRYLRMCATQVLDGGVTLGTTLGTAGDRLQLTRNCAKVVVRVRNAAGSGVTVNSIQLCDISRNYHYVTGYEGAIDAYYPQVSGRFDDDEKDFPDDGEADGDYRSYTWYIPANKRDADTDNDVQNNKNLYAPEGATHLRVYATYPEGGQTRHLTYTYYLGGNLTNDFSILPNHKYTYTIDITGKGDPLTDARVEHMDDITFVTDANCYMLKTPTGTDQTRTYKIPVRRAAVFWNRPGENMGVYGAAAGDASVDALTEETAWTAEFVWNKISRNGLLLNPTANPEDRILVDQDGVGQTTLTGKGFNPVDMPAVSGHNPFIRIRVEEGMKGNALVAVKVNGTIVWSWHIWVTDYDPYVQMTPVPGTYIYTVPGGEIHRYAGNLWVSGDYAGAFMMDRNLGAVASEGAAADTYGFMYQWGRKDPFAVAGVSYSTQAAGTAENIRTGVHNPTKFFTSNSANNYWTAYESGNLVLGNATIWNDPKNSIHGSDYCEVGKSIYDPCPPGWTVPVPGTWSDIQNATTEWSPSPTGRYYYPEGAESGKGRIWYPTTGFTNNGSRNSPTQWAAYWRNSPVAIGFQFTSSSFAVSGLNYRSWGMTVRCVRLSYSRPY